MVAAGIGDEGGEGVGAPGRWRGVEQQGVPAEGLEVVEALRDTGEVAEAVTVGVLEAGRIDAVKEGATPPGLRGDAGASPAGAGEHLRGQAMGEQEQKQGYG